MCKFRGMSTTCKKSIGIVPSCGTESALCVSQSNLSVLPRAAEWQESSVRWHEVIVRIVVELSTVASLRVRGKNRGRDKRLGWKSAISLPIVLDGELVAPVAGVTEH